MALKTFNLDKKVYEEFSKHCKKHGISMSKRVDNFIKMEMKNIKMRKSDIGDLRLEIEKDVEGKQPQPPNPEGEEHAMGKYC